MKYLYLLVLACLFLGQCSDAAVSEKKNFVVILVDDMGAVDCGFSGSEYYETPHIDRLARMGTVFTQGYAASRVCSPSRASIMTGQFTARHGITDWIGARSGEEWRSLGRNSKLLPAAYNHRLDHSHTTLGEAFSQNGYETFFAGKWHLGDKGSHPEDHGFQINKGGWKVGSPKGGYFSPWENPSLPNLAAGENLSHRLAKETNNFIEANASQPFLAFLSFYAVHGPIQTTEEKWDYYRNKADSMGLTTSGFNMERNLPIRVEQDNPIYAGLVEQVDEAVGMVLNMLDSLGIADETAVIFTSDNGGVASGDAYSTSNLPLRGGKGYQWEGGIREPFIIYAPWIKQEKLAEQAVIGTDIFPTILDLAGLPLMPAQHMDGLSLLPLMEGGTLPERPLFWHYPHYGNQGGDPSSIIRKGKWKLIQYYENEHIELYDLESDPQEESDLALISKEIADEMTLELRSWLVSVNANMARADEEFDPALAAKMRLEKINDLMPRLEKQRLKFLETDFDPGNKWWGSTTLD